MTDELTGRYVSYAWLRQECPMAAHGAPERADASGYARRRCQRTLQTSESGSFYPVSFLPSTRKILGPAQRPHPLGKKEIQRTGYVFSFSHSFFFLQKKEWEKKEKRHPRSLRFFHSAACPVEIQRRAVEDAGPYEGNRPHVISKVLKLVRNLFWGRLDSSPVCAPVRNDRIINRAFCLTLGFDKSAGQPPTERQSERMRAVMRGDGAQKPFRLGKRFFLSMLFLSKKRKSIGPAQRPPPLGKKKTNAKNTFFLFPILSFSCKRKNGRRKKNAIQDRFALFHSAAFGGTHGGLLRNAACPAEIRRQADDIRPYKRNWLPSLVISNQPAGW